MAQDRPRRLLPESSTLSSSATLSLLDSARREKRDARSMLQQQQLSASLTSSGLACPTSKFMPAGQSHTLASTLRLRRNTLAQESMVQDLEKRWAEVKLTLKPRKGEDKPTGHRRARTVNKRPEKRSDYPKVTQFSKQAALDRRCMSPPMTEDLNLNANVEDDSPSKGINQIRIFGKSSLINGKTSAIPRPEHRHSSTAEEPIHNPEDVSPEPSPAHDIHASIESRARIASSEFVAEGRPKLPHADCGSATQFAGTQVFDLHAVLSGAALDSSELRGRPKSKKIGARVNATKSARVSISPSSGGIQQRERPVIVATHIKAIRKKSSTQST